MHLFITFTLGLALAATTTSAPLLQPILSRQLHNTTINATYDFVVIGGGTAGLVVATRLAQASYSVAVIEAGGFYEDDIGDIGKVPAFAAYGAGSSPDDVLPDVDWGFVTTPQAGLNDRKLHYARGKTLGGSSARNYYTYQRPTIDSLDKWASVVNDTSYTFDAFLPFYKKSIDYTPPNNSLRPSNASVPSATNAFSEDSGPVRVSFSDNWVNPISSFFQAAWEKLGLPVANDFVSGSLFGVQYVANTINPRGNVRESSYSFLRTLGDVANLHVYNHTMAKRILFDGNLATGAVVCSDGMEYVVSARKEVILSAGVFQSPQLLMVSGVGPKATLEKLHIPIISSLEAVGQHLEDHLLFSASYHVLPTTHSALGNSTYFASASAQYAANGRGILSNPGGEIVAWEKLIHNSTNPKALSAPTHKALTAMPPDWPTFEYLIVDAYQGDNQNYIKNAPQTPFMYASPAAAIMVQQSRGNVTINSSDTSDLPLINPNWLTHPADQELSLLAFKRVRQMMDAEPMRGQWVEEVVPGRNVTSDEGIMEAVRRVAIQVFHAACTCRMGTSPHGAVIDSKARVFGTRGLRVVDASAMPFLPPGHPQATIYALAEKIAEDIIKSN
ncbi:alcohol oxidase [Byssothecium circinans]|uniref:Alcohol oxidase n=1 Tax=Byssothecium circinans TaxID=147558 RepID=A0A6A5TKQ2_9PLEO|nr:alcohol oxidase [Byssothecium circinans]